MNIITKASLLAQFIHWRFTWDKRNTKYAFTVPGNPKFMGPRDAAKLIPDGAVVMNSGLGGNARASILYWAIREMFEETGHPSGLTVIAAGGIGGRGRVPGTVEEYGVDGLTTRFISGHLETFKSILRLADAGKLTLECIPQGTITQIVEAQGRGEEFFRTNVGLGTFIDPRTGRGTPLAGPTIEQLVEFDNGLLKYHLPKVTAAVFNLPAADRDGNLYSKNSALLSESYEAAIAAKRNGGVVIANVGLIVEKGYSDIFLPADKVDAVVQYPGTEQTGSVKHRKHWSMFTPESKISMDEGVARLKFINTVLKVTPVRGEVENALSRLAASVFAESGHSGMFVNVGVGLPEEVCRLIFEGGLVGDVTFFSESGVIGGLPAPGVFFGSCICPKRMVTSASVFKLAHEKLDCTILGILQADSAGNVNVSKRGEGAINYVGPGGFMDFAGAAKTVIFVGSWMAHAKMAIEDAKLKIITPGTPKFVDSVDEITFSGAQALEAGKNVYYVTNVGVFKLTSKGMTLCRVMPGVDIQRDIVGGCGMRVVLPDSGEVPVVDASVVTGKGFSLALSGGKA